MLEIFALVVLVVVCAIGLWLLVIIGNLPGNLAREAGHPQAEAISYLAWIGLLTLGVAWFVALVWAKLKPIPRESELEQRIAALEGRLPEEGEQA